MNDQLLPLVQTAKAEVEAYGVRYNMLTVGDIAGMHKVLSLLEIECRSTGKMNERVLRAFKDVCTMVAIRYEDTPISDPVFRVSDALERSNPRFKSLPLLRMEFGKGDPI